MNDFDPPISFDEVLGKALRDEGMARVIASHPDFAYEFLQYIIRLPIGWEGKTEDIRKVWTGPYGKPQSWGACTNGAIKRKLLVWTGRETPMQDPKSHSRNTRVYRRV